MVKRRTKTGNSLARVLDVIVISPARTKRRNAKLRRVVAEAHARFAGAFARLAK